MKKCMKAVGLLCAAMMSATALTGCSLLEGLLGNGLVSSSGNESSVPEKTDGGGDLYRVGYQPCHRIDGRRGE